MKPDFSKYKDGLVPAIVQDHETSVVLMLGFMNDEAYTITMETKKVTFFSRTRHRIWTKGESSGNFLQLVSITTDCDNDTLLVKAVPQGPVCHTGSDTCFNETNTSFSLSMLERIISQRQNNAHENSYTSSLFSKGINAIAQKVGEEAVELVIESKDNNRDKFLGEAADLLFHYLVLLRAKDVTLGEVENVLSQRHNNSQSNMKK